MQTTPTAAIVAACALVSTAARAEVVTDSRNLTLAFQQDGPAYNGLRPHPNVVQFLGISQVELGSTPTADGEVKNPLYHGTTRGGENALYQPSGGNQRTQLEIPDFGTISMTMDSAVWHLASKGIVHRDLACRNLLLTTNLGNYASLAGDTLTFGSDGPMDVTSAPGSPPMKWMAPESIRLYRDGDAHADRWIDIQAGATLDTIYTPAPGTLGVFAGLLAAGTRRRR